MKAKVVLVDREHVGEFDFFSSSGINVVTHPAPHHADDIFSTAMLAQLFPNETLYIHRTRDPEILSNAIGKCIIYDVGEDYDPKRKLFNHHHSHFCQIRKNGIKYASAGLIWREYGRDILRNLGTSETIIDEVLEEVDYSLIENIDALDNSQLDDDGKLTISSLIAIFNTNWTYFIDEQSQFLEAFDLANRILMKKIEHTIIVENSKQIIASSLLTLTTPILIMESFINGWSEAVLESELPQAKQLLYGVYPDIEGRWDISAVPISKEHQMHWRKPFPQNWRGLEGDPLTKVTGVDSAIFCHLNGFFAVAKYKKDAIRLANLAVGPYMRGYAH